MEKVSELLTRVVGNAAVRKAFVALVMAVLTALGVSYAAGCAPFASSLSPAQQRALDAHKCYVAALEPAVGELAPEVLKALLVGGDPVKALLVHNLSVEEALAALHRLSACQKQQHEINPQPIPAGVRS